MINYDCRCRACDYGHTVELELSGVAPTCPNCGSDDTYRETGKPGQKPVNFRHNAGDMCGWALSGYSNEKHYDLGKLEGSKAERWGKVKN